MRYYQAVKGGNSCAIPRLVHQIIFNLRFRQKRVRLSFNSGTGNFSIGNFRSKERDELILSAHLPGYTEHFSGLSFSSRVHQFSALKVHYGVNSIHFYPIRFIFYCDFETQKFKILYSMVKIDPPFEKHLFVQFLSQGQIKLLNFPPS